MAEQERTSSSKGGEFVRLVEQIDDSDVDGRPAPTQKVIDWFHQNAGRDALDMHHRLGTSRQDASPGDHTHDGIDSMPLYQPGSLTLTDLGPSPTTAQIVAAVNALNAALRQLGAG